MSLYGIESIQAVPPGSRVVVLTHGSGSADRLNALGVPAASWLGWRDEHAEIFAGHHVVLLPGNDDFSEAFIYVIAPQLDWHAASVRVLRLPRLPFGHGVSDWLASGGTRAKLAAAVRKAPRWQDAIDYSDTETARAAA